MRRRELMRRGTATFAVAAGIGTAGCSGANDDSDSDNNNSNDNDNGGENSGDDTAGSETSGDGSKQVPFGLGSDSFEGYQTAQATVESLTFHTEGGKSVTVTVGETVDLTEANSREGVIVSDSLEIPYGTYESVDMELSVEEIVDGEGSTVDITGGTVSHSFVDSENNIGGLYEVVESEFASTLTLYFTVESGQIVVNGHGLT